MQPPLPNEPVQRAADLAACRAMLRSGSRTFFAASLVLPADIANPATALYAFCRLADDAVDVEDGGEAALLSLRDRLARAYDGCPLPIAADRAFADVVAQYAIPKALPEALLEGIAWDAAGRHYEDISDLYAYAARVAGAVGAMMCLLMGRRAPEIVARACDLGVAMQLTNIARDVGEDARDGRLYLPLRWLRDAGIEPDAWLRAPCFNDALATVVQRLLRAADVLYARAESGIAELPFACRPGIYAARYIYAEIGRTLERNGLDSVSHRAVVGPRRKAALLLHSFATSVRPGAGAHAPVLDEVCFLVDAVAAAPAPSRAVTATGTPWWKLGARAQWVIELCERLEQQELAERSINN